MAIWKTEEIGAYYEEDKCHIIDCWPLKWWILAYQLMYIPEVHDKNCLIYLLRSNNSSFYTPLTTKNCKFQLGVNCKSVSCSACICSSSCTVCNYTVNNCNVSNCAVNNCTTGLFVWEIKWCTCLIACQQLISIMKEFLNLGQGRAKASMCFENMKKNDTSWEKVTYIWSCDDFSLVLRKNEALFIAHFL